MQIAAPNHAIERTSPGKPVATSDVKRWPSPEKMPRDIPRIFELELWSRSGSRAPLCGKTISQQCRDATGLSEEVVLGLSSLGDETDPVNLRRLFEACASQREVFLSFCREEGLTPSTQNQGAACRYLAYVNGQALAWLHFPAADPGPDMARTLLKWASSKNFVLVEPETSTQLLDEASLAQAWRS
jgi:hypothetical protein